MISIRTDRPLKDKSCGFRVAKECGEGLRTRDDARRIKEGKKKTKCKYAKPTELSKSWDEKNSTGELRRQGYGDVKTTDIG